MSPKTKGLLNRIVSPPNAFEIVFCAAKANARPPIPSPASKVNTSKPKLSRAIMIAKIIVTTFSNFPSN